jgi:hypothetical protein
MDYPLFKNPKEYIAFRRGNGITAPFKRWAEWHGLDSCLKGLNDIRTVCDCPCGPGRLFPYWKKRGFNLIGVDLSDEMVEAAHDQRNDINITGRILKADAFHLEETITEKPDLVASIRFCYYFDRPNRIQLLRSLAQVSRKYVLVQYKTPTTLRGRISFAKSLRSTHPKYFCSNRDIIDEIKEAGLVPLRVILKGDTSDRAFVLVQKPDTKITIQKRDKIYYPRTLRNSLLVAAAVLLFFGFISYRIGFLGDIHERQVERIVRKYQGSNDHFYVTSNPHLEDLRTGKWLSLMPNVNDASALVAADETEAEDSFFLILEKDIPILKETPLWAKLYIVEEVEIGTHHYVLLSTEKSSARINTVPIQAI